MYLLKYIITIIPEFSMKKLLAVKRPVYSVTMTHRSVVTTPFCVRNNTG